MYILLNEQNVVLEIIPDENPIFPGVSIHDRYAPEFVKKLKHFSDETPVEQNWIFNAETSTFSEQEILSPDFSVSSENIYSETNDALENEESIFDKVKDTIDSI